MVRRCWADRRAPPVGLLLSLRRSEMAVLLRFGWRVRVVEI